MRTRIFITLPHRSQSTGGRGGRGSGRGSRICSVSCSSWIRRLALAWRRPKSLTRRKRRGSTCLSSSQRNTPPGRVQHRARVHRPEGSPPEARNPSAFRLQVNMEATAAPQSQPGGVEIDQAIEASAGEEAGSAAVVSREHTCLARPLPLVVARGKQPQVHTMIRELGPGAPPVAREGGAAPEIRLALRWCRWSGCCGRCGWSPVGCPLLGQGIDGDHGGERRHHGSSGDRGRPPADPTPQTA